MVRAHFKVKCALNAIAKKCTVFTVYNSKIEPNVWHADNKRISQLCLKFKQIQLKQSSEIDKIETLM